MARAPTIPAPTDLTLPARGSTTVRGLYSAALSAAMSATLSIVSRSPETAVLAMVLRAEPGLLARSLRAPSRLVLVRCLVLSPDAPAVDRDRWRRELLSAICLDVAEAGRLPSPISIDLAVDPASGHPRPLFSIDRERSWPLEGATRLRFSPGNSAESALVEVTCALSRTKAAETRTIALEGSRPLFASIPGGWKLALDDNNPLASLEAHPDKSGSLIDLGGKPIDAWTSSLGDAFSILERYLPEIVDEMRLVLGAVVPVGFDDQRHLSASYLEAIGLVYLTLHPNVMTLAEALVHEFQHNKLNLLLGLDPVLDNGDFPLFSSPVRPDPRPLRGVLLAVHAFHPVVVMYERMIAANAPDAPLAWLTRRLGEVARMCREGCEVLLPNAIPSPIGTSVLAEIRGLDQRFERYAQPHPPAPSTTTPSSGGAPQTDAAERGREERWDEPHPPGPPLPEGQRGEENR